MQEDRGEKNYIWKERKRKRIGTDSKKGKLQARGADGKNAEMDVWMVGGKWTEE